MGQHEESRQSGVGSNLTHLRRNTHPNGSTLPGGNALARALQAGAHVGAPDQLKPYSLASPAEKLRRARGVLLAARRLFDANKRARVWDCLLKAGDGRPEGWWARQMFQAACGDLNIPRWEAGPRVCRQDVRELLDLCISKARGHCGGWRVYSSTPSASSEPAPGVDVFVQALRGMHRRGWKPTIVGSEG